MVNNQGIISGPTQCQQRKQAAATPGPVKPRFFRKGTLHIVTM